MHVRYPRPLVAGDRIGVTSPSSGVRDKHRNRLRYAIAWLEERGYEVEIGSCMDGSTHISGTAQARASELMGMLLDPAIRAVVPPWGGETAIDLLPLLNFDALKQAEPTWFVGFSDISTLITPITLNAGWATIHGGNLMDTPYAVPSPLLSWLDVATAGPNESIRQSSANVHRVNSWDGWATNPEVSQHSWNGAGTWRRLGELKTPVDVVGRLIGGCIETFANTAGTPYGNTQLLRGDDGTDPLIVYIEAAGDDAYAIYRHLHGMRLAGFFDGAAAIMIDRTSAPNAPFLSQDDAIVDALGTLGVPMIADVECGHVPPQMALVNGSRARLIITPDSSYLEQQLT